MKKFLTAAALVVAAVTMSAQPALAVETGNFHGTGIGPYPTDAISSAEKVARTFARNTGWLDSQCYVRSSDVRSQTSYYSATVWLYCQR
ncbi:hypothetical protein [Amycolatopsis keratiniphila]|uniref:Uncharacterized protein n=1 Tax=Amycolatopsis keratiniphila subsp. keratiniphila TaxID=227715 RepID=A0A1W2LY14_9PSEU|nr:hypothetical protein [Amycolatopsis keratiniphila]ONF72108.1 hypothetical protein AVR91_0211200 [Amycolatopsis keratiniphila subsp. keratiniphila]